MLAKLVVTAENRDACLARSRRALEEYRLLGFVHNVKLHRWVLDLDEFISGHYSTKLLEEHLDVDALEQMVAVEDLEVLAAALALVEAGVTEAAHAEGSRPDALSPWGEKGRSIMTHRGH
jgi:acetyl/propionyl-CoA carboxylase alpha subunit